MPAPQAGFHLTGRTLQGAPTAGSALQVGPRPQLEIQGEASTPGVILRHSPGLRLSQPGPTIECRVPRPRADARSPRPPSPGGPLLTGARPPPDSGNGPDGSPPGLLLCVASSGGRTAAGALPVPVGPSRDTGHEVGSFLSGPRGAAATAPTAPRRICFITLRERSHSFANVFHLVHYV
ncbi:hypothetical protein NDU88_003817 [Pleurodeles waltl]|uniref:Uncharacterized protein n=1 Tax=Pleurodeles waltl TaxID=8319 RepID=A0AAV7UDM9_PLEWA|nr:hypothetical protein NDU88_003817 [Pleurodeles waltl]